MPFKLLLFLFFSFFIVMQVLRTKNLILKSMLLFALPNLLGAFVEEK